MAWARGGRFRNILQRLKRFRKRFRGVGYDAEPPSLHAGEDATGRPKRLLEFPGDVVFNASRGSVFLTFSGTAFSQRFRNVFLSHGSRQFRVFQGEIKWYNSK